MRGGGGVVPRQIPVRHVRSEDLRVRVRVRVRKSQLLDQDEAARPAGEGGRKKQSESKRSWMTREEQRVLEGLQRRVRVRVRVSSALCLHCLLPDPLWP